MLIFKWIEPVNYSQAIFFHNFASEIPTQYLNCDFYPMVPDLVCFKIVWSDDFYVMVQSAP